MLYVIRPYEYELNRDIFALLQRAGISTNPQRVFGIEHDEALLERVLRGSQPDSILIPFNATQHQGRALSGLKTIRHWIRESIVEKSTHVVMPVAARDFRQFKDEFLHLSPEGKYWLGLEACVLHAPFTDYRRLDNHLRGYVERKAWRKKYLDTQIAAA